MKFKEVIKVSNKSKRKLFFLLCCYISLFANFGLLFCDNNIVVNDHAKFYTDDDFFPYFIKDSKDLDVQILLNEKPMGNINLINPNENHNLEIIIKNINIKKIFKKVEITLKYADQDSLIIFQNHINSLNQNDELRFKLNYEFTLRENRKIVLEVREKGVELYHSKYNIKPLRNCDFNPLVLKSVIFSNNHRQNVIFTNTLSNINFCIKNISHDTLHSVINHSSVENFLLLPYTQNDKIVTVPPQSEYYISFDVWKIYENADRLDGVISLEILKGDTIINYSIPIQGLQFNKNQIMHNYKLSNALVNANFGIYTTLFMKYLEQDKLNYDRCFIIGSDSYNDFPSLEHSVKDLTMIRYVYSKYNFTDIDKYQLIINQQYSKSIIDSVVMNRESSHKKRIGLFFSGYMTNDNDDVLFILKESQQDNYNSMYQLKDLLLKLEELNTKTTDMFLNVSLLNTSVELFMPKLLKSLESSNLRKNLFISFENSSIERKQNLNCLFYNLIQFTGSRGNQFSSDEFINYIINNNLEKQIYHYIDKK